MDFVLAQNLIQMLFGFVNDSLFYLFFLVGKAPRVPAQITPDEIVIIL